MTLFGTDGIRGRAGQPPLDPHTVARVGAAVARGLARPSRVLIGRDTRESGVWIETELARGLASQGAAVVSAGVIPTPEVAYLARTDGFDAGIVISASHNPFEDNGIKVFSGAGAKLTAEFECEIERTVADRSWDVPADAVPTLERRDLNGPYLEHLRRILDRAGALAAARIVLDCANGATAGLAPALFTSLGFNVTTIGANPNGRNINLHCGSTHLDALTRAVVDGGARLGIAFDGDGDRALLVDHRGAVVDGDAILLIAALDLQRAGRLPRASVVATVMSNVGLEIALRRHGISLVRCAVGDKHVMEEMQQRGLALGGEQSGHVIFADHLFTGDGLATALHMIRIVAASGRELAELAAELVRYPQVLVSVRVRQKADYMQVPAIADAVRRVEARLGAEGRLLVRYSGTEPLLRIMLEGRDDGAIRAWADEIAGAVREHLGVDE
jgi:phosphoglucosamine mutase